MDQIKERQGSSEEVALPKYECDVCGYIYDPEVGDSIGGIESGTPFDKLPDDWVCPICGADKTHFHHFTG